MFNQGETDVDDRKYRVVHYLLCCSYCFGFGYWNKRWKLLELCNDVLHVLRCCPCVAGLIEISWLIMTCKGVVPNVSITGILTRNRIPVEHVNIVTAAHLKQFVWKHYQTHIHKNQRMEQVTNYNLGLTGQFRTEEASWMSGETWRCSIGRESPLN